MRQYMCFQIENIVKRFLNWCKHFVDFTRMINRLIVDKIIFLKHNKIFSSFAILNRQNRFFSVINLILSWWLIYENSFDDHEHFVIRIYEKKWHVVWSIAQTSIFFNIIHDIKCAKHNIFRLFKIWYVMSNRYVKNNEKKQKLRNVKLFWFSIQIKLMQNLIY